MALLVRDSSNLRVKQNVIVSGTTGSVHQAATWTEEFLDSLSQNHSHPVEEVHIYAGDMNARIAQEVENHLSLTSFPFLTTWK